MMPLGASIAAIMMQRDGQQRYASYSDVLEGMSADIPAFTRTSPVVVEVNGATMCGSDITPWREEYQLH